ncbi:hypothetical protein D3C75_1194890 [compost metagenome]
MAFSNSASTWVENIRFNPEIGFMRLASNLRLKPTPPSSIGADSATSTNPARIGISAHTA